MKKFVIVLFSILLVSSSVALSRCSISMEEREKTEQTKIPTTSTELLASKQGVLLNKHLPDTEIESLEQYYTQYEKKILPELKKKIRYFATKKETKADAEWWYKMLLYNVGADYAYLSEQIEQFQPSYKQDLLPTFQTIDEFSEEGKKEKQLNVLFIVDMSEAMESFVANEQNIRFMQQSITHFARQLPEDAQIAIQMFGHNQETQPSSACENVSFIYPLQRYDEQQINAALSTLETGKEAPLSNALLSSKRMLEKETDSKNYIYLLSSGADSCGKDPLKVAKYFNSFHHHFYVFGIHPDETNETKLKKIAKEGNGLYISIHESDELLTLLEKYKPSVMDENRLHGPSDQEVIEQQRLFQQKEEWYQFIASNELSRLYDAIDYMNEKELLDEAVRKELKELINQRGVLIQQTCSAIRVKKNEEILTEKERLEDLIEQYQMISNP